MGSVCVFNLKDLEKQEETLASGTHAYIPYTIQHSHTAYYMLLTSAARVIDTWHIGPRLRDVYPAKCTSGRISMQTYRCLI